MFNRNKPVNIIREEINKNPELYLSYQEDIAMSFINEINKRKKVNKNIRISINELWSAANMASIHYLNTMLDNKSFFNEDSSFYKKFKNKICSNIKLFNLMRKYKRRRE